MSKKHRKLQHVKKWLEELCYQMISMTECLFKKKHLANEVIDLSKASHSQCFLLPIDRDAGFHSAFKPRRSETKISHQGKEMVVNMKKATSQ